MSVACKKINIDEARQRLTYDPATGVLTWKDRISTAEEGAKVYQIPNNGWAGKRAGKVRTCPDGHVYRSLILGGEEFAEHRVCWAIYTGEQPPDCIDHGNGDATDNRWVNLGRGDGGLNERNKVLQKNNASGVCGVTWRKKDNKWQARITVSGRHYYLGLFEDIEDARAARIAAEKEHGFSERHGKQKREVSGIPTHPTDSGQGENHD